jgi:hypothetical protein
MHVKYTVRFMISLLLPLLIKLPPCPAGCDVFESGVLLADSLKQHNSNSSSEI